MNRLRVVEFKDNRPPNERPISLEFVPISVDLKEAYSKFSHFVWDYMGTTSSPPIGEVNTLLLTWLTTSANLFPKSTDWETLAHILDLVSFLSELQKQSKELEFYEDAGRDSFDYVNNQPDLKEVGHE